MLGAKYIPNMRWIMKKIFTKLLAVMLVCLFAISGFNFSVIADNSADHGEKLAAMNIEVSGKISLMFYFTNMNDVSYFKVTVPNKDQTTTTTTVNKSGLKTDSKGRYLLKVPVAAAQQADKVTVTSYNSANVAGKSRSFSVKDYADILFTAASSNSSLQPAVKAVEAMLNYGAMAQAYFGYNTENPANADLYYRGTNPVDDMDYEDLYGIVVSQESGAQGNGQISFTAVNAYLEDTVSLRFYFEYSGSTAPENLQVQINKTPYPNQVLKDEQGKYYVLINNIPATLFNETYQVLISDGPSYAVVKYSVLNYLQDRLAKTDDQKFMDVAYSMFQFYGWTNEYQNNPVISGSAHIDACRHDRTHINNGTKAIICSDCGKQTGTAGSFGIDANGTVTSGEGFSYAVSGGDFEVAADNGLHMEYGEVMTISGANITSTVDNNYFGIDYYATAPVKVTMTYQATYTYTKDAMGEMFGNTYTATGTVREVYYLEAGENVFNAFEHSALDGRANMYDCTTVTGKSTYTSSLTAFALQSIQVTPLTEDGADFVMFKYTAGNKSVSFETQTNSGVDKITEKMIRTSNAHYKLGVSITYGGALSELYDLTAGTSTSDSTNGKITKNNNLINRYDTGRLIQQSYYGTMGETDSYDPRYYNVAGTICKWNYNPVQGGDMSQNRARLIDYEVVDGEYIYIKTQPRDWACQDSNSNELNDGGRFTFCYMENRYTLVSDSTGNYVQVDNRMVDFSGYDHPYTHQELPAFYTLSYFDDFYWYNGTNPWTNDTYKVEDGLPFWGDAANATRTTFNFQACNTETWGAYVNQTNKYGLGMYVPNIDVMKGGISDGEGDTNEMGMPISYFTAMKVFKIVAFEPIEYSYLLCAGHIDTIRATFTNNKDFSSNYSLNKNSISQKLPNEQDMTSIDFSDEDNLLFLQAIIDMKPTYDAIEQAAKITTTGGDSYFHINYDLYSDRYTADNYSCIEIEYMIPQNKTLYPTGVSIGQELYYQLGSNTVASGDFRVGNPVTLIADGKYHTAKIYTATIPNWTGQINSLRFDFLNNGIGAGQVIYLKSFSLTNAVETNANDKYIANLDVGFAGSELVTQITDGNWENPAGLPSASLIDEDYVRVTFSTDIGDRYFGILPGGSETGKYMVMRYRTSGTVASSTMSVFATTGSATITGSNDNFQAHGLVADGRWHTLVIDLSASGKVTQTLGKYMLNQVRIDIFNALMPGSFVDFAYIGFCNDVNDVKLADGEYLEYQKQIWTETDNNGLTISRNATQWTLAADSIILDGSTKATALGFNHAVGSAYNTTLYGFNFKLGGWFGVANITSFKEVSYCVIDENGVEHIVSLPTTGGTGFVENEHGWYTAEKLVQDALAGYNCTGYRLYVNADLTAYTGQTVLFSIRAITSDGNAVTLYNTTISVEEDKILELDPYYNMNFDSFLYATRSDYTDCTTVTGIATNWNGVTRTNTLDGHSKISARFLAMMNFNDGSSGGWLGVNGYALAGLSYNIYAADGTLLTTGVCQLTEAPAITTHLKDQAVLGYTDGTVGYYVTVPVIDLTQYATVGSTVTFELSATLAGVNANPIIPLIITVTVAQ